MRNAGLEEAQTGIKISRRNINNLTYADDTTLMAESEEETRISGNFVGRIKGAKCPFDLQLLTWDFS